jgi:predicted ABC-type ATPase
LITNSASQFWLIAGANGSGKTSVASKADFRAALSITEIINPDSITRDILSRHPDRKIDEANLEAVQLVEKSLDTAIDAGQSVGVETVLSTLKYLPMVLKAKSRDYVVSMIYVAVRDVEIAVGRVNFRVSVGGHSVPEDKIRARWERSHEILPAFVPYLVVSEEPLSGGFRPVGRPGVL